MATVNFYLGYDPGGRGKFGAAALRQDGNSLSLVSAMKVDSVSEAKEFAQTLEKRPSAAAIDAPLTWSMAPSGFRSVDLLLRSLYPDDQNKVMATNSLYGAVAVQGPALAIALTELFPSIIISETTSQANTRGAGFAGCCNSRFLRPAGDSGDSSERRRRS